MRFESTGGDKHPYPKPNRDLQFDPWNKRTAIFNNENVNTYENVVCEMSAIWARPQCLISLYDLETL